MTVAANITASGREYTSDLVPTTSTHRQDFMVSPGAAIIFPNLVFAKTDLRLRYNFIFNDSNDDAHDYRDHIVAVSVASKF